MDKKNGSELVDLSSFLLVEGSADSEAGCELLKLRQDMIMVCDYDDDDDDDDDDAESCSCDTSDAVGFCEIYWDQDCNEFDEADHRDCSHGDKASWCRCKMWLGDGEMECMHTEDGEEECKHGTILSKDVMDQMEDSLFWETCLAVGYP